MRRFGHCTFDKRSGGSWTHETATASPIRACASLSTRPVASTLSYALVASASAMSEATSPFDREGTTSAVPTDLATPDNSRHDFEGPTKVDHLMSIRDTLKRAKATVANR